MPKSSSLLSLLAASLMISACAETPPSAPPPASEASAQDVRAESDEPLEAGPLADDLATTVEAMGALDRAYGAQFSPSGDRLLYLSSETGLPQLFISDIDGSNAQQISQFEDQIRGIAWSPDGATLAIDLAPDGGLNRQIYLRPLRGGEMVRITEG